MRSSRLLALALPGLAVLACSGGCTSVAAVTNPGEPVCSGVFERRLEEILTGEGEATDVAARLARDAVARLAARPMGPRAFVVSSPSGADYELFVQKKRFACLLRLYARQKGFTRYTNNLTFIATRALEGCACAE